MSIIYNFSTIDTEINISSIDICMFFLNQKKFSNPLNLAEILEDDIILYLFEYSMENDQLLYSTIKTVKTYEQYQYNKEHKSQFLNLRQLSLYLNGWDEAKIIAFYKIDDSSRVLIKSNEYLNSIKISLEIKRLPLIDRSNNLENKTIGDVLEKIQNLDRIEEIIDRDLFEKFFYTIIYYLENFYKYKSYIFKRIFYIDN